MNESSKAWLNVAHFDNLTTTLAETRRGTWEKLEITVTQSDSLNDNNNQDPNRNVNTNNLTAVIKPAETTIREDIQPGIKRVSNAISQSNSSSQQQSTSTATAATAENQGGTGNGVNENNNFGSLSNGGPGSNNNSDIINRTQFDIVIHGINDMTKLDCIAFQNWYSSEFALYQTQQMRTSSKIREKLIYSSHRMVPDPSHEDDQQSYFAVYRSQFDTTEFIDLPPGQNFVNLRIKLKQESPVWSKCSIRNVTAFKFIPEDPNIRKDQQDTFGFDFSLNNKSYNNTSSTLNSGLSTNLFSRPHLKKLEDAPRIFDAYSRTYDMRYRFFPHEERQEITEICLDPNFIRK